MEQDNNSELLTDDEIIAVIKVKGVNNTEVSIVKLQKYV